MDEADAHPFQGEPRQAVLEGAHDTVVRVVECQGGRLRVGPRGEVNLQAPCRREKTSHPAGQNEVVPVPPAQRIAPPEFRESVTVQWCSVEKPRTGVPCGSDHRFRGRIVHVTKNVAQRGGSEPETGDFEAGAPESAGIQALRGACSSGARRSIRRGCTPTTPKGSSSGLGSRQGRCRSTLRK